MDRGTAVLQSSSDDRITKTRTLYDVGPFEIFWRNFLAGASRALGGFLLYIIFGFVVGYLVMQVFLPRLEPLLDQFMSVSQTLDNLNTLQIPGQFPLYR